MPIRPLDRLRYYVPSQTSPDVEYLVDLGGYNGAGLCDCKHHKVRIAPKLSRTKPDLLGPSSPRCKHLNMAREFLTCEVIKRLIALEDDGLVIDPRLKAYMDEQDAKHQAR